MIVLIEAGGFYARKYGRWGSRYPKKEHSTPTLFSTRLLWPNGRLSQLLLSTCYTHYESVAERRPVEHSREATQPAKGYTEKKLYLVCTIKYFIRTTSAQ